MTYVVFSCFAPEVNKNEMEDFFNMRITSPVFYGLWVISDSQVKKH